MYKAILKQINKREPVTAPFFRVASNGDLVRHVVPTKARRPGASRFTLKEVWPDK